MKPDRPWNLPVHAGSPPSESPSCMRAKVFHLITGLASGGAQSALLRLLARLDQEEFLPVVACYFQGDTPVANQIRALGIPVHDLGMQARAQPSGLLRLYRLLQREKPQILHTWLFHANVPGRVIGRLARVPVVISSERTMGQEKAARRRLNRLTAPCADRILCVSESVRDYAATTIGLPPAKLQVIPNGIDLTAFQARSCAADAARDRANPVRLIYVGRLQPVKGVVTLMDAMAHLEAIDTRPWQLTIVGDGALRSRLEERVQASTLQSRVIFLGERQDVPQLLRQHDLLVLPSRWEGMPNAALEAMACALPVVATAVGGTPEVVVQGETGLLVPPENPAALATALATLIADPEQRRRMGLAGRLRIESCYSLDATVKSVEALYRQLLARR